MTFEEKNGLWGFQQGLTQTRFKMKRGCTNCETKAKVLISCAGTAQLVCAFGFAYVRIWFSHDMKLCCLQWIFNIQGNNKKDCCLFSCVVAHIFPLILPFCLEINRQRKRHNSMKDNIHCLTAFVPSILRCFKKGYFFVTNVIMEEITWQHQRIFELPHGKTSNLHRRKQRRRSASQ